MATTTDDYADWEKFTLTVIQIRQRKERKTKKTLIFDLSHVVQPEQIQFVLSHDKEDFEKYLEKEGVQLSNCSPENIELSLESSGNVDEVGVQATNLIIKFLLQYVTKPFYLSEDEAETKYEMKEELKKDCHTLNADIMWKEHNVIKIVGTSENVRKCFMSLMTFCQGTGERTQNISRETLTEWVGLNKL